MNKVINYGGKNIYNNNNDINKHNKICSQNMDKSLKHFIAVASIVCLACGIALLGPVYSFVVNGNRSTLLSLRLPIVEKDSDLEFLLLLIMQPLVGFYGFFGNIGIEAGYNLNINVIRITTELIQLNIRKMTGDLEARRLTKSQMQRKLYLIFDKIKHSDR